MFLKERATDELVEIIDTAQLFDPFQSSVLGRYNAGEDLPDPQLFEKGRLVFCSGEGLPRCWIDPDYRREEIQRTGTHA